MYSTNVGGLHCCNCKQIFGTYYCSHSVNYITKSDSKFGFREFDMPNNSVMLFCSEKCRNEWLFAHYEDLQD